MTERAYRIGWFSSGRDKAAIDLLKVVIKAIKEGEIPAQIAFVFSNIAWRESPESDSFLRFAIQIEDDQGSQLITLPFQEFQARSGERNLQKLRQKYDEEIMDLLRPYSVNLIVLAGYMQIVGEEMCRKYNMINLHPAAPGGPAGSWGQVIDKLIEKKAEYSGVTMHLVTPKLDQGPPVTYCTFSIRDESNEALWEGVKEGRENSKQGLFNDIRYHRGLPREFPLIISTLKALAEGKIRIKKRQVLDDKDKGKVLKGGYDLTPEIEEEIKRQLVLREAPI